MLQFTNKQTNKQERPIMNLHELFHIAITKQRVTIPITNFPKWRSVLGNFRHTAASQYRAELSRRLKDSADNFVTVADMSLETDVQGIPLWTTPEEIRSVSTTLVKHDSPDRDKMVDWNPAWGEEIVAVVLYVPQEFKPGQIWEPVPALKIERDWIRQTQTSQDGQTAQDTPPTPAPNRNLR